MLRVPLAILVLLAAGTSCRDGAGQARRQRLTAAAPAAPAPPRGAEAIGPEDWVGVYSSTEEIGGFTGTVLALRQDSPGQLGYRMRFFTDRRSANDIEQDERRGSCLVEGRTLYLPTAWGYYHDGKPQLQASVDRYTLAHVNGQTVLMRDDALRAFRGEDKLYDYGILIKVEGDPDDALLDLKTVEHKSIKTLYTNTSNPWRDPFVSGPNRR